MVTATKTTMHGSDPTVTPVVKDVYKDEVLTSSNEIEAESPVKTAATDYLKKVSDTNTSIMDTVTKSITSSDTGVTLDFTEAKSRLETSFGISGTTSGLSTTMKNDIGKALTTISGTAETKVIFNDIVSAITAGSDAVSVTSVVDMVNSISGSSEVFKVLDLEAQASFVQGMASTIIDWGVPELLDTIITSIEDSATLNALLESSAITASKAGSLSQTKYFADRMGVVRSFSIHSTLIKNLMENYEIDSDNTTSYLVLGNEVIEFFNWLSDSWAMSDDIIDLNYFTYANDDMVSVLSPTAYGVEAELGSLLSIEAPMTTAGKLFDNMPEWQ